MPKSLRGSRITGTGHYAPDRVMSNFELEEMVDTSNEWIVTRTGIRERRIAGADEACSDLAFRASVGALESARARPEDLDGIVLGTVTGDTQFPATSCIVQERLGATNAAAFDLSAACSGFVYGLSTAHGLIASGQMDRILVIGVDLLSKFIDWQDRTTCVLFGDGAGAVMLEACKRGEGILGTYMKSDGALADLLHIPAGGSKMPASRETCEDRNHFIKMKGDGVFKYAVRAMADAAEHVVAEAGVTLADVDLIVPHQANIRIIDAVTERLGIRRERVVVNVDRYGNTSSGTIPIAFDEVARNGRVQKGNLVLFVTFGGGFTWGSVLLRYT